jgi:hypothetical protein
LNGVRVIGSLPCWCCACAKVNQIKGINRHIDEFSTVGPDFQLERWIGERQIS